MREHPIIFSGPMVRAILEGRKSQTRRVIKPQPSRRPEMDSAAGMAEFYDADECIGSIRCPYGQPGDRLWVRETFACWSARDIFSGAPIPVTVYRAGRQWRNGNCPGYEKGELFWKSPDDKPADVKWKPSIHMPRWASRITLEITDVRVGRVQDISEADARTEGVLWVPGHGEIEPADLEEGYSNYLNCREGFRVLWDSINAKKYPWSANPWVWALTFKRVEE